MYGFLVPSREEHIVSGLFFIALCLDILWYWRLTTIYFFNKWLCVSFDAEAGVHIPLGLTG
jgi:hypothetical protein